MWKHALALLLGATLASAPIGCASRGGPSATPSDPRAPAPPEASADPSDPPPVSTPDADEPEPDFEPTPGPPGPTAMDRVQSAVDGMFLGAVLGSTAGPLGAAVGAGAMLIYSAITGHVPLRGTAGPSRGGGGGGGGGDPDGEEQQREEEIEREIEKEAERGEVLENQIEEELRRQEELLEQIESGESAQAKAGDEDLAERADPRTAPEAPKDRELPMAIFEKEKITIPAGAWGTNKNEIDVVKRTLDADRDGKAEEIRYFDEKNVMIRREQDQDFDGTIDTWSTYAKGQLTQRDLDTNADGKVDTWEVYREGRMTSRQIDRDHEGTKDAFYVYEAGALVEEKHDGNNDGSFDLVVDYQNKLRTKAIEDRDHDGKPDTWTDYSSSELVVRVEKDTDASGKADVVEIYSTDTGKSVLARREEDRNGDGTPDITSIYENGKLVRREISDPALVPL